MANKTVDVTVTLSKPVQDAIEKVLFPVLEENKKLREALTHLHFAASMNRCWEISSKDDFIEAYPEQADWENGDVDEELCQALSHAEAALEVKS